MAGELQAHFATGAALYAVLLNESSQPWNGATFDATPTTGEWASYVVALTEWSTTGLYRVTMPAGIVTPGTYQVLVYKRLGGAGTEAPTDPVVWSAELAWSGSAVVGLEDVPSAATVADAVWDEALSGHSTSGTTGAALSAAAGASNLGSGSESVRIRCLSDGNPVDGAAVWLTSDEAGTDVVAGTVHTDATGWTPTLQMDPGDWWVWRQVSRVNFDPNPEQITVTS